MALRPPGGESGRASPTLSYPRTPLRSAYGVMNIAQALCVLSSGQVLVTIMAVTTGGGDGISEHVGTTRISLNNPVQKTQNRKLCNHLKFNYIVMKSVYYHCLFL